MNRRWLVIVLGILGIISIFEILNNPFALSMLVVAIGSFFLRSRVSKNNQGFLFLFGVVSLLFAIFSSRIVLAFLVVGALLFIGDNPEIFQLVRNLFTNKKEMTNNDFIMVDFEKIGERPVGIVKNRWFGEDSETEDDIYSWEDINFSKIFGNTVFDLGNTILPKENNVIMIRKGVGKTKLLIPEGVAVSINVSMLVGKITLANDQINVKNETIQWISPNYSTSSRRLKLVSNVLIGEVEVIFL